MDVARGILLKEIRTCEIEHQIGILRIRNQPEIRNAMFTSHEISESEHLNWLTEVSKDSTRKVYIVLDDQNKVLGAVIICKINLKDKSCDWAFYLDAEFHGNGLGVGLEYYMLNYIFKVLKFSKLNCEVLESNPAVVNLHKKFGFVQEDFRVNSIEKNGKRVGVHLLGITDLGWLQAEPSVRKKAQSILSRFDIEIN